MRPPQVLKRRVEVHYEDSSGPRNLLWSPKYYLCCFLGYIFFHCGLVQAHIKGLLNSIKSVSGPCEALSDSYEACPGLVWTRQVILWTHEQVSYEPGEASYMEP